MTLLPDQVHRHRTLIVAPRAKNAKPTKIHSMAMVQKSNFKSKNFVTAKTKQLLNKRKNANANDKKSKLPTRSFKSNYDVKNKLLKRNMPSEIRLKPSDAYMK